MKNFLVFCVALVFIFAVVYLVVAAGFAIKADDTNEALAYGFAAWVVKLVGDGVVQLFND